MDLDSFIKETLIQIAKGIKAANEELADDRKKPDGSDPPKLFLLSPGNKQEQGNGVHFDVAVTSEKAGEGKGGAKFKLAVVEAELGGGNKTSEQTVSRIKFSVNVNQWHG